MREVVHCRHRGRGPMDIEIEVVGPVGVVRIARPDRRNAVDRPTAVALRTSLAELDARDDLAALVLSGTGGSFCAGADLHALEDPDRRNDLSRDGDGPMGPTRITTRLPTIAAIEGYAVAGGLELALWCDVRIVASDATLGVLCRRIGVPLIDGGTVRLPRIVGLGTALDLILTGREIGADEARRIGLATRVVAPGATEEAAIAFGSELARWPRETMLADLASAREAFDRPLSEALLVEHDRGVATLQGGAASEAIRAFQQGGGRHGGLSGLPGDRD